MYPLDLDNHHILLATNLILSHRRFVASQSLFGSNRIQLAMIFAMLFQMQHPLI